MTLSQRNVEVNRRCYAWPQAPVVVVCVDGCEPDYLVQARRTGATPWLDRVLTQYGARTGDSVVPSFTNPNNVSIVTGVAPSVHGICGNYFLDVTTGREVTMNDPAYLRAPTLLAAFAEAGAAAKQQVPLLFNRSLRGVPPAAACATSMCSTWC